MKTPRKRYSAEFKARLALEVIKGQRPLTQIASEHCVHPTHLLVWKKQLLDQLPALFADRRCKAQKEQEELTAQLYQQIGQLKVEVDWLKKKLACSVAEKRRLIEREHPQISLVRQCQLLGLSRSGLYYHPRGQSVENLLLMRLIDEQCTNTPFFGYRKVTVWLREQGYLVNRKRVQRLMQVMGLEAIYPKPTLSKPHPAHRVYPYLWRGVPIQSVNQVWSADITYIRRTAGFMYLVAILDWYSRYVLVWEVSTTLDTDFCLTALERALRQGRPQIFNTDQGAQFTSAAFTGRLEAAGSALSMDGRGRALDNIFVERLWRTLKYEAVYLHEYASLGAGRQRLGVYFPFYNTERPHQALGYRTPAAVYHGS